MVFPHYQNTDIKTRSFDILALLNKSPNCGNFDIWVIVLVIQIDKIMNKTKLNVDVTIFREGNKFLVCGHVKDLNNIYYYGGHAELDEHNEIHFYADIPNFDLLSQEAQNKCNQYMDLFGNMVQLKMAEKVSSGGQLKDCKKANGARYVYR